jgi:hypothetical protein
MPYRYNISPFQGFGQEQNSCIRGNPYYYVEERNINTLYFSSTKIRAFVAILIIMLRNETSIYFYTLLQKIRAFVANINSFEEVYSNLNTWLKFRIENDFLL